MRIYSKLMSPDGPIPVRQAALIGAVRTNPAASMDALAAALQDGPDALQTTAVALVRNVRDEQAVRRIAGKLFELSPLHQAQLLSAFSDMDQKTVILPVILDAVGRGDDAVVAAGLKALAAVGDSSCVSPLAEKAASGSAEVRSAARESLIKLSGAGVDDAILSAIGSARPPVKIELIRCLAPRAMTGGTEVLFGALDDPEPRIRIEAFRALSETAGPEQLPRLVDRLAGATTDADRREAVKTVTAVGLKISDPEKRGDALIQKLQTAGAVAVKSSLLEALGKLGDPNGLPVIRKSLSDRSEQIQSSAVLALSDWPSDAPMNDLLNIARKSRNETLQTLALRGVIRLTGSSIPSPDDALRLYLEALSLAEGVPEKQAVFSGVAKVASTKALDMAMMNISDPDIGNEAEAAALQIIRNIREKHPDEANEGLKKLLSSAKNPSVKQEAEELAKEMEGK
jgi:HEAT repeat protein